ncbi:hypothetical protein DFH07DRAFT_523409 [Mycena maculata]|uniref:Mid2 domain-containing protein n=1 Tax=Mycena maculata TaxID=230809 RepID=A0AAD7IZR0_9AGAR|nr:hypothetical protein DFH07DRAFT_523409 [Mycena maculata]
MIHQRIRAFLPLLLLPNILASLIPCTKDDSDGWISTLHRTSATVNDLDATDFPATPSFPATSNFSNIRQKTLTSVSSSPVMRIGVPIILGLGICLVIAVAIGFIYVRRKAQIRRAEAAALDAKPGPPNPVPPAHDDIQTVMRTSSEPPNVLAPSRGGG